MTQRLDNPFPLFLDATGAPLHNGAVYMGVTGQDPETHPLATFWDQELTIPATQPLQVMGGTIVNQGAGGSPAFVYAAGNDYSIRVRDADGGEVFFLASTAVTGIQYQPLNAALTTIAGQTNTTFGMALLTLANQAALKAATGFPEPLPLAGGALTGNVTRQGAGALPFFDDATLSNARMFVRDAGDPDPTTQVGQILFRRVAP